MASTSGRRISYVDLEASSWDRANSFLATAKEDGYQVSSFHTISDFQLPRC